MDLLNRPPAARPETIARIRAWVVSAWPGDTPGLITVTQLRCLESGCPPIETVIVVAPAPGKQHRFAVHVPADDLTEVDIRDAINALEAPSP